MPDKLYLSDLSSERFLCTPAHRLTSQTFNWVLALLSNYYDIKVHKHEVYYVDLMNLFFFFPPNVGKKCFFSWVFFLFFFFGGFFLFFLGRGRQSTLQYLLFPLLSFTQCWPWKRRLDFANAVLCLPIYLCRICSECLRKDAIVKIKLFGGQT